MSAQRFYASPKDTYTWQNGAIGHCPGGPMDCLGPFAKVTNCPVDGTSRRYTCYATAYPDTCFTIPGCTRICGKYISGYFFMKEGNLFFQPAGRFKWYIDQAEKRRKERLDNKLIKQIKHHIKEPAGSALPPSGR